SYAHFTVDTEMSYISFAKDHGPLNLAYTYAACVIIHEEIAKTSRRKALCIYTTSEPKVKSNIMLAVALYWLIVGHMEPWTAFSPIATWEVMPFRDAGNGIMDHGLSIQECLYGMHKAIHHGLVNLKTFDPQSYQYFETVGNGDLNVIGPFIPFASPMEEAWAIPTEIKARQLAHNLRRSERRTMDTEHSFKCVMKVFSEEKVGLVVRLNEELYDRKRFLDQGMEHVEMYFDDGSNPTDAMVREFIRLSETVIEKQGRKVAVHCKAGLGRTGVLIGAYLIYKYSFSAQEVIGFMRIIRPGMVVGPQQQYMLLNQMKWIGWVSGEPSVFKISSLLGRQRSGLARIGRSKECSSNLGHPSSRSRAYFTNFLVPFKL
ncbi:hypothetical protein TREMEDRAFT_25011, partial [Tremella mesenterica DSM 1558]|uniref:uncharacterized protein n=1 Tax=Tremella mesenterica (strain ATCC 24925 / CBS 8224 / DSM 1558 / NBRC 9311 / NRRL Y-6157 / RJB 2259-6 / UBC 559-6) TaxID=578456 RepID=UPI0003F48DEE